MAASDSLETSKKGFAAFEAGGLESARADYDAIIKSWKWPR